VQKCLAVVAVQRRVEEERLQLQQVIYMITGEPERPLFGSILKRSALAFAAGNRGVRRERKEEDVGVKDSSPNMAKTMAKTVEIPVYLPPVPATTLTPGGIEVQAQPAEPLER